MKLDVRNLRYMTKDDFRALSGVEAGMRNHELVPVELIASLAGLRHGGIAKVLSTLLKFKLIAHDRSLYDGYKLTYSGYDYLALRSMLQRDTISGLGRQIGVGKESDVYLAENAEGTEMVLKLQRLGRTSFRAIKTVRTIPQRTRCYLRHPYLLAEERLPATPKICLLAVHVTPWSFERVRFHAGETVSPAFRAELA